MWNKLSADLAIAATKYLMVIAAVATLFLAAYIGGVKHAEKKAAVEKAELIQAHQAAALTAEREYSKKLAEAAAEQKKWFDFTQEQSSKLAAANRQIDTQAEAMKKGIPYVIQKDGAAFNGLGADSLQHYNRSLGYSH